MTVLTDSHLATRTAPLRAVRPWTIAAAFGLIATVVCAAGSWIPSLWGDEATSLLSAKRPIGTLLPMLTHVDAVHGLYYLLLHGWIRLAGESPFALRFPSAVAIGLAVAAVTLIAGRRGGPQAAVVAGIVATVLPRLTYAGEEARSYAGSAALAAWLTLLILWLIDGGGRNADPRARRAAWILYSIGTAVSAYLFLYSASLLLAHAALILATRAPRRVWRAWAIASGSALIAAMPLIVLGFLERNQISYLQNDGDDPTQYYYQLWFGIPLVAVVAWPLVAAALAPAWAAWRRERGVRLGRDPRTIPRAELGEAPERPLSATVVGAAWLFVPTAALLLVNAVFPMYTARYSTFVAPAAALLVAEGVLVVGAWAGERLRRRGVAGDARWHGERATVAATTVAALLVIAACTPAYILQRGPFSKNDSDWAQVSAAVGEYAAPGDAVVFDESTRPSWRPRLAMRTYPAGFSGVRDVTLETPYYRNIGWADRAYSVEQAAERDRFDGVTRVWVLEYSFQGVEHTYGLSSLERLGFRQTGVRLQTHRTLILELRR
ncbi:glycosyltransferase family 39 protein [Leifsonia sp. AG29]|uniref:glycosyltransferase family 39 protein n=1 Tax=Leifsonia sp. AG29 TaxID=2598860 RepID=UPI00131B6F80|nr:glycosyltransferase family 39 protein [Leifsonia sp. AG29]